MFPKTSRFNKQESCKGSGTNSKQKYQSPYGKAAVNACRKTPLKAAGEQTSLVFNSPSSKLSENTFRVKVNHQNYGRHSMPPRGALNRTAKLLKSSIEQLSKKSPLVTKQRSNLPCNTYTESTPSPQTSSIPRLKRKLTEPLGPSCLERSRIPHNCFSDHQTSSYFNRNSAQRHPVKQLSKTPKRRQSGDHSAQNQPPNVSYTNLRPAAKKIRKLGSRKLADDPDEALDLSVSFHVKHSSSPVQEKLSEPSFAHSEKRSPQGLRCFSLKELEDCNVVLLLQDQFIDDSYGQFMKPLGKAVETLQLSQADTLLQWTEQMVRLVTNPRDRKLELQKIAQLVGRGSADVEGLVHSAVNQLKDFEEKILRMARERMNGLLAELKTTLMTAQEDMEAACNDAVKNLIALLKKPALEASEQ